MATDSLSFIADAMLGRLARWLRILGFDVLYDPGMEDPQLIRTAQIQGRTIITRDTRLVMSRAARNSILVRSDHVPEQLAELRDLLGPFPAAGARRCAVCNGNLAAACKEEIRDAVPDDVCRSHDQFMRCRVCHKVYWEGSHCLNMKETLKQVLPE